MSTYISINSPYGVYRLNGNYYELAPYHWSRRIAENTSQHGNYSEESWSRSFSLRNYRAIFFLKYTFDDNNKSNFFRFGLLSYFYFTSYSSINKVVVFYISFVSKTLHTMLSYNSLDFFFAPSVWPTLQNTRQGERRR